MGLFRVAIDRPIQTARVAVPLLGTRGPPDMRPRDVDWAANPADATPAGFDD